MTLALIALPWLKPVASVMVVVCFATIPAIFKYIPKDKR
jgi:hypothetical protein